MKTEKSFRDYLKTLSDDTIMRFYLDIEWSPFPILVIEEYQQRFKSKTKDQILHILKKQASIAKKKSIEMKQLAKKEGLKISELGKIKTNAVFQMAKKRGFDIEANMGEKSGKKIQQTKKYIKTLVGQTQRKKKNKLILLEKLAALRKSKIITQKEFLDKKKKILSQI